MTRFLIPCLMTALLGSAAAFADEAPTDAARKVIESQLAAFARNDADEAYSFAAPEIQAMFPDSLEFLSMVAHHYPVVYHHRSVEFRDAAEKEGHVVESVMFTDEDGKVWQAIYKLEQESDGRWAITGCVLAESAEQGL
jgi:hypothetical protein